MRGIVFTIFTIACIFASGFAARADDSETIARLIGRLGGIQYAERAAATKALEDMGTPALDALRCAVSHTDAEIARRAQALVRNIEKRRDREQLLAPQMIHLHYQDAPVIDAVQDLARKTGYPIRLEDPARFIGKRVTLDTGRTTFWHALAEFCQTAGLAERPTAVRRASTVDVTSVVIMGGRQLPARDVHAPQDKDRPAEILLAEGTPRTSPAHVAGALRLATTPVSRAGTMFQLSLEATPEPDRILKQVFGVHLEHAVDDLGRPLTQRPVTMNKRLETQTFAEAGGLRGVVVINGELAAPGASPTGPAARIIPLFLQAGDGQAKSIREIKGVITALMLTAPEPLVRIDHIVKQAGQTIKGVTAGSVRVVEIRQAGGGQIHLRVLVEAPPRRFHDADVNTSGQIVVVNGKVVGGIERHLSAANFRLEDAAGKPFQILRAVATGRDTDSAQELELTYAPKKAATEAFRFVYTDRRAALVEISFTLRNMPLAKAN